MLNNYVRSTIFKTDYYDSARDMAHVSSDPGSRIFHIGRNAFAPSTGLEASAVNLVEESYKFDPKAKVHIIPADSAH